MACLLYGAIEMRLILFIESSAFNLSQEYFKLVTVVYRRYIWDLGTATSRGFEDLDLRVIR